MCNNPAAMQLLLCRKTGSYTAAASLKETIHTAELCYSSSKANAIGLLLSIHGRGPIQNMTIESSRLVLTVHSPSERTSAGLMREARRSIRWRLSGPEGPLLLYHPAPFDLSAAAGSCR